MSDQPTSHPPVKGRMTPYLMVADAYAASDFYTKALGAQEVARMPRNEHGHTMHVHLYINDHSFMMSDPLPEQGRPLQPQGSFNLMLPVDDVDAAYKRAIDAGATSIMAPEDAFWGDRYAMVEDPYGIRWSFSKPLANRS